MTPARRGAVDELLEPAWSWPERTMLPTVSEGMPGSRACPPQIDEHWCGTRQPNHPAPREPPAPAFTTPKLATSTNTLTRPHSFRNADLLSTRGDAADTAGHRIRGPTGGYACCSW
jgi:hypothetical protein